MPRLASVASVVTYQWNGMPRASRSCWNCRCCPCQTAWTPTVTHNTRSHDHLILTRDSIGYRPIILEPSSEQHQPSTDECQPRVSWTRQSPACRSGPTVNIVTLTLSIHTSLPWWLDYILSTNNNNYYYYYNNVTATHIHHGNKTATRVRWEALKFKL